MGGVIVGRHRKPKVQRRSSNNDNCTITLLYIFTALYFQPIIRGLVEEEGLQFGNVSPETFSGNLERRDGWSDKGDVLNLTYALLPSLLHYRLV